jgi:Rps23 Pro-64 3,4-dihydroxylase Tpa1-like proline 4-hydroxylase
MVALTASRQRLRCHTSQAMEFVSAVGWYYNCSSVKLSVACLSERYDASRSAIINWFRSTASLVI